MAMGITQALKMQTGSLRELAKLPQQNIVAMAQRGDIPAPMVPIILSEKARMTKEAQNMQAMQQMQGQGMPPSVTEQNMQTIGQAEMQDAMQQEAMRRRMMSGVGSLPVPEDTFQAAGGGIVAFEDGGPVERYASRGFVAPSGLGPDLGDYGVRASTLDSLAEYPYEEEEAAPTRTGLDLATYMESARKQYVESPEEKAYADYMRGQRERTAGQLEQDRAMNLINLGAQIMSGTSPYALTNIGQGLAAGLPAFQKTAQAQREAERENLKGLAEMSRQRSQGQLGTALKLAEIGSEEERTRQANAAKRFVAQMAARKDRDTFGDRQVQRMANSAAQRNYNKPLEELPPDVQRLLLGSAATDYQRTLQAAQFAGVGQRETAAEMEDRFRREESLRRDMDSSTDSVDKALLKTSDPRAIKYRELIDSGKEEEARAYRQRMIDADFEARQNRRNRGQTSGKSQDSGAPEKQSSAPGPWNKYK